MTMPEIGEIAPAFELQTDAGETVRLADFHGKRVVLFFYPRADTSGCTIEACGFRDSYSAYEDEDVVILGISPDTVEDQAKFSQKYNFPYPLLADADHRVAELYGVWGKNRFGHLQVLRTTFVIDEQGVIEQVFKRVKPEGHSEQVLASFAS